MKRLLMDGLCELTGAGAWIWTLGCQMEPGEQPVYLSMLRGGFDEERYGRLLSAANHPDMTWLTEPILRDLREKNGHVTRTRRQMTKDEIFLASDAYPLWCAADIGPVILSLRPLDGRSVSSIGLYRRKDEPMFGPRECRIAHIVLSEVSWLHEQGWPEDRGATVPRLTPKERLVLNFLLDGRSRKEIAAHLELSENTVSGYAKALYRYFQVNSHAGLLRRFQQGDGGDQ